MIVLEFTNFFIVLPILLKTCNLILFLTRQNLRARKIGHNPEVLRDRAQPIGIGRAICPGMFFTFFSCNNMFVKKDASKMLNKENTSQSKIPESKVRLYEVQFQQ